MTHQVWKLNGIMWWNNYIITLQCRNNDVLHYDAVFLRSTLSLYCICLRGSCRREIVVWLWPASKRIFQSLLLKFELMRFQNMSAPCDNERAWRSWGTARDASWQNSDFNMDHKLEHKSTCVNWLKDCWAFFLTKDTGWHVPGNEHLFLNVGQELGMIFAGQIQALSMETKDLQTVHHVE